MANRTHLNLLYMGSEPLGDTERTYWWFDIDNKEFCFNTVPNGCKQFTGLAAWGEIFQLHDDTTSKVSCTATLEKRMRYPDYVFFTDLITENFIIPDDELPKYNKNTRVFRCYQIKNPRSIKHIENHGENKTTI